MVRACALRSCSLKEVFLHDDWWCFVRILHAQLAKGPSQAARRRRLDCTFERIQCQKGACDARVLTLKSHTSSRPHCALCACCRSTHGCRCRLTRRSACPSGSPRSHGELGISFHVALYAANDCSWRCTAFIYHTYTVDCAFDFPQTRPTDSARDLRRRSRRTARTSDSPAKLCTTFPCNCHQLDQRRLSPAPRRPWH